ncbi:guanitoxin biosynthesis L-enduracididine beta-hydroxylase GntD [Streptomyces sp. LARHCF252]
MPQHAAVINYDLSSAEVTQIEELVADLIGDGSAPASPEFNDNIWRHINRLPDGLRQFLQNFRRNEPAAACIVDGFPVSDVAVGPTPLHWRDAAAGDSTRREECYLALLTACLGDVFGWSTLQAGRLLHNVLPVPGEESQQSGHGSDVLLEWHTEDGFHPYRCDYLGLFGVRNHDKVPTTFACVTHVEISEADRAVLFGKRFLILPDEEHLRQLEQTDPDSAALRRLRTMRDEPEPVAVLFGAEDDPYLRIDPYFMSCVSGDDEAEQALKRLVAELERVQQDIVVTAGATLFIDNYRAVHGRRSFVSRYDGTDRWLKKSVSTRDLRRSRDMRRSVTDRVLA